MNSITIQSTVADREAYTLLAGPKNFFRLRVGVSPSFGIFRCDETTYTNLVADHASAFTLTFIFEHPTIGKEAITTTDALNTITISNLYLVKAIPVLENCYDIILADERILWPLAAGTKGFNLHVPDVTKMRDAGGSEEDYYLIGLNAASEWTYRTAITQIFADITTDITGTWTATYDTSYIAAASKLKPRNVQGYTRPIPAILALLLRESHGFLAPPIDLFKTHAYRVFQLGTAISGAYDLAALKLAYAGKIHHGGEVFVNNTLIQGDNTRVLFGETPYDSASAGDDMYSAGTEVNDGEHGQNTVFTPYTHFDQGSNNNDSYLNDIATALGAVIDTGFDNENLDITLVGWHNYATKYLGPVIHEIEWGHNKILGAYTKLKAFKTIEPIQPGEQKRPTHVHHEEGMPRPQVVRRGLAEILTVGASGAYTIKVLERYSSAWNTSSDKPYDNVAALDINARVTGTVGQKVLYWQEVDREGLPTQVIIDVGVLTEFPAKIILFAKAAIDVGATEPKVRFAYGFQEVELTGGNYENWTTKANGYGDGTIDVNVTAYNFWEDNFPAVYTVQSNDGNARTDGLSSTYEYSPDGIYYSYGSGTGNYSKALYMRDDQRFRITYHTSDAEWRVEYIADTSCYWALTSAATTPSTLTLEDSTGDGAKTLGYIDIDIRDLMPVPKNTIVTMYRVTYSNTIEFWFHSAPHLYSGKNKSAGDNIWLYRYGDEVQHIGPENANTSYFPESTSGCIAIYAFDRKGHCIGWWHDNPRVWSSPWGISKPT